MRLSRNTPTAPNTIPLDVLPAQEQQDWKTYWDATLPATEPMVYPAAIDMKMIAEAMRHPAWPRLWITPNGANDLRHLRSYFLVPLLEQAAAGEHELLRIEIEEECKRRERMMCPVTDIFVLSHGWHRSLFAGVAAYDRLFAKFLGLIGRGRITPSRKFSPLFICCHWHSDPGEDAWVDPGGRREKTDFLQRAHAIFEPKPGCSGNDLVNALEEAFVFMSRLSAPDIRAASGKAIADSQKVTNNLLATATLKDWRPTVPISPEIIVTTLWGCFNETKKLQVLVDQTDKPRPVAKPFSAVKTLIGFIMGLGLPLATLFSGPAKKLLSQGFCDSQRYVNGLTKSLRPTWLANLSDSHGHWAMTLSVVIYVASLMYLGYKWVESRVTDEGRQRSAKGWNILLIVAWLPVQVVHTLPLLILLLFSWIFRTAYSFLSVPAALGVYTWTKNSHYAWYTLAALISFAWIVANIQYYVGLPLRSVFGERLRNAGDEPWTFRDYFARFARCPITLVRASAGRDSAFYDLTKLIDNQLAFFDLQRKGVDAGDDFGRFLSLMYNRQPELKSARLHFVGHSFGGLVILNAARRLFCGFKGGIGIPAPKPNKTLRYWRQTLDSGTTDTFDLSKGEPLTNVVLLQAATASDWFRDEKDWARYLRTGASIFSKYDTANGFWYPLANNGRLSAGYVGLCKTPCPPDRFGKAGEFAMLIEPPQSVTNSKSRFLNLDASRIIFQGATATGGGHDDIFKDDVINLIWSITRR